MSKITYTNNWDMLKGEERIRRWPSKIGDKRGLTVEISSWCGISIGAKHIYLKIKEEDNMWWCEKENCWVRVSCDSEKGGYSLEADLLTNDEAVKLAKFVVDMICGPKRLKHDLLLNGISETELKKGR